MASLLDGELIRTISNNLSEPEWLFEIRQNALQLVQSSHIPDFGPSLDRLDLEKIQYYSNPLQTEAKKFEDLPQEIQDTYIKLGIKDAEKKYLGGSAFQYDSKVVYHKMEEYLKKLGVVFENLDNAAHSHPELFKKYFGSVVAVDLHYFSSLHYAARSGGTFIYIPKGVHVPIPLQSYFRMNERAGGQFEHTLIIADEGSSVTYIEGCSAPKYSETSLHAGAVEIVVHKDAHVKYVSIENWSDNTYNLNTKRAIVHDGATISWVNATLGAGVTMLYPTSILEGDYSRSESLSLAISRHSQIQDTGTNVIHKGIHTKSTIESKTIVKDGGEAIYRGKVIIEPQSQHSQSFVSCDTLVLDNKSVSKSIPHIVNSSSNSHISHEAITEKIDEDSLHMLECMGVSRELAIRMIVGGFSKKIVQSLPFEYAIEFNTLLDIEMNSI